MKQLICQPKEMIANFVSEEFGAQNWEDYSAIGMMKDDKLIAGVIYNHFSLPNICMHVASEGRHWLNREFLFAVFDYPFNQLGCGRITALVPRKNIIARKFDKHIGFKYEGRLRRSLPDGDDMMIYGMLKEECKWLNVSKGS